MKYAQVWDQVKHLEGFSSATYQVFRRTSLIRMTTTLRVYVSTRTDSSIRRVHDDLLCNAKMIDQLDVGVEPIDTS